MDVTIHIDTHEACVRIFDTEKWRNEVLYDLSTIERLYEAKHYLKYLEFKPEIIEFLNEHQIDPKEIVTWNVFHADPEEEDDEIQFEAYLIFSSEIAVLFKLKFM